MKEPELLGGPDSGGVPGRRKVSGGKALARLLDFQARRGRASDAEGQPSADSADMEAERLQGSGADSGPGAVSTAALGASAPSAGPTGGRSLYLEASEALRNPDAGSLTVASRSASRWRPLGPFSIPHGQTYGRGEGSRPSVSGRISSVAVDPENGRHLLIGCGGGGIWQSFDRGVSWAPVADELPSLSIGAIAFDPSDPDLVYAGTGEGDTRSWLGLGLLRSTDRGTTWELFTEAPFQGVSFFDLLVDPADGERLWAATSEGLFASEDRGLSWVRHHSEMTFDLSLEPADPADPAASRELLAGCRDGVLRSEVGSADWRPLAIPGLPATLDRLEVCHAPSTRGVAFLAGAGQPERENGPSPYFFRRDADGQDFEAIDAPADLQTGQAWYDWHAAVDPEDADRLYVGAIELHRAERSDSGFTWTRLSARDDGPSIHPDQHAMAFDPQDPAVIYAANDGGLYASQDRGATWSSLNKGLAITEFQFIAHHRDADAWMIGGTQDNGTLRYEGLGLWYHVQDGDGGDCGASDEDPYTCFHTFYGMGVERSQTGGAWGSWDFVGPFVSSSENYPRGALFYPPVEVRGSLIVQAGKTVRLSSDGGERWRKVRLPEEAKRASALAIPDVDTVYVGTEAGHVYRIEREDGFWDRPKALASPTDGFISDLVVDPGDPERLWVTCSHLWRPGVFRSDDAGASWTAVSDGLPRIPINAIEVDPTSPDTVYVAADVGVHRSLDAGATWSVFADGLPNALVKDLLFHPPSRVLRAATQSRGVWEIAVDQPQGAAQDPDVQLFIRDSVVDTGLRAPSPSGVDDPFRPGEKAHWWQSPDIKIDAGPFETPEIDDLDFEIFGDSRDHRHRGHQFATGLRHEVAPRGQEVRVYVQVNNRGTESAERVAVRVFAAALTDDSAPPLDADFWDDPFTGTPDADAVWRPVADREFIDTVDPGRSRVLGFFWQVPDDAGDRIALLALASADNDALGAGDAETLGARHRRKAAVRFARIEDP